MRKKQSKESEEGRVRRCRERKGDRSERERGRGDDAKRVTSVARCEGEGGQEELRIEEKSGEYIKREA